MKDILDIDIGSSFIPPDNIPLNLEVQQDVCSNNRASVQIGTLTARLPSFMKSGTYDDGCGIYPLKEPIVIEINVDGKVWKAYFKTFVIYSGKIPTPDEFGQWGRARLKISSYPSSHIKASSYISLDRGVLFIKCGNGEFVDLREVIVLAITEFNEYSLFDLVKHLTPYNTPERVCRFFGNPPGIFEPLKVSTTTRLDSFHEHKQSSCSELKRLLDFNPDCAEEELVKNSLHEIVFKNNQDIVLTRAHAKIYGGWLRQAISFKNNFGEIVMVVLKLFCPETQSKVLIPATSWMNRYSPRNKLYCVPLPNKQILLHLKRLLDDEVDTVMLTDSIEIASINQDNAPKGVVWTGFLCSPGEYSQIDFSPLQRDGVEVNLLITNHSGKSLEEAYIEARSLADHLIEKYELKLRFVQVEVDYHDK